MRTNRAKGLFAVNAEAEHTLKKASCR